MMNFWIRATVLGGLCFVGTAGPALAKDDAKDNKNKLQSLQQRLQQNQPKSDNKPRINAPVNPDVGKKLQQFQQQQQQQQQRAKDAPKVFQKPPQGNNNAGNDLQQRLNQLQQKQPKVDQPKLPLKQGGQIGGGDNKPKADLFKPKDGQPQFGNQPGKNPFNQPGINPDLKNKLDSLKPKDGQPQFGNKPGINPDLKNKLDGLKPKDGQPQFGNKPILGGNKPGDNPFNNPDLKNKIDGLKPKDGQPQIGNKPVLPGIRPGDGVVNKGPNTPNLGKGFDLNDHLKKEADKNPKLKQQLDALQGNRGKLPVGDGKGIIGGPLVKPGDKSNPLNPDALAGPFKPKVDLQKGAVPIKIDRNQLMDSLKRQQDKPDTPKVFLDLQKQKGPRNDQELQQMFAKLKEDPQFRRNDKFAVVDLDRVSGQFQNRLNRGDFRGGNFNRFADPRVQKHFMMDTQFALRRQGDVARQLNLNVMLNNGGGWRARPIGPVFHNYTQHHFSSWYPGPSWGPSYCWTPMWRPWVSWSFWNWCVPIYDPRPFICRPIIYDPCPPIVIYEYPVWQPLPVVAAGTWIDVPPVVIDNGFDLELLAVRFVDPGHQEQNYGPRYRVWVRNNSPAAIGAPFNITLVAANGPQLLGELPQAGTTVPSIDANSIVPVDIRLPLEANRLGRQADGTLVPFSHLHVLVDSHRDLAENNEANNGAMIERGAIYPVDPAAFSTDVTAASPGSMVSLAGEGFGPEPGQLLVTVNGQTQTAEVHGWYDLGINFKVPDFNVGQSAEAEIIVVRGDSAVSNPVELDLAPQGWLQEAQLPPAPVPGGNPVLPPAP